MSADEQATGLQQILLDLLIALGISDSAGAIDSEQTRAFLGDPLGTLAGLETSWTQQQALGQALVGIWNDALGTAPEALADLATGVTWLPIPLSSEASATGPYLVLCSDSGLDAESDGDIELGLGLVYEGTIPAGDDSPDIDALLFLSIPLVGLSGTWTGNPLVLGLEGSPIQLGVQLSSKDALVSGDDDHDWYGIRIGAAFGTAELGDLADLDAELSVSVQTSSGGSYSAISGDDTLQTALNTILAFPPVASLLSTRIFPDPGPNVNLGNLLSKGLGLLQSDDSDSESEAVMGDSESLSDTSTDGSYTLSAAVTGGSYTLTPVGLFSGLLKTLSGSTLITLPNKGTISVLADTKDDTTRFGVSLALPDLEIPLAGGPAIKLQLGKWFTPPSKDDDEDKEIDMNKSRKDEGGGDDEDKDDESEGVDSNWTNDDDAKLGLDLYLVSVTNDSTSFDVELRLVSVGVDVSGTENSPLVSVSGWGLASVQGRAYVGMAFGDFSSPPTLSFGGAGLLEGLTVPLSSSSAGESDGSNPVAKSMLEGDGDEDPSAGGTASSASTVFSVSGAWAPEANSEGDQWEVQLYDAEGKDTDVVWFDVQAGFGPISLSKLGAGWTQSDKKIALLVDGGLQLAGLGVTLDELSVGFTLDEDFPKPSFGLSGMSLSYSGDGLDISGGFSESDVDVDGVKMAQYSGELIVRAGEIGLSALGSYAASSTGETSLFVFATLDAPLGGPPFFFVTGLAGGFGVNRSLLMPSIDEVVSFPLVTMAVPGAQAMPTDASGLGEVLDSIGPKIPITWGEEWFAAGVLFTSFELLQSFALVSVSFGNRFELDILGLTTLTLPPDPTGAEAEAGITPIAEAQLALEVEFAPDEGLLAVQAQLTDNSYVLSKDCHLSGGFALFIWFDTGEFVVSLGGYNDKFDWQSHGYPDVPRLGLNWVLEGLSIEGGLYFALTPSCVMAGGALDVAYTSPHGHITASFSAYADFLLGWRPFYYDADMGVSISGHFKLGNNAARKGIGFSASVDLQMQGPPFGGTAVVDISAISFTVSLGASDPEFTVLDWTDFAANFLPGSATSGDDCCKASIAGGLQQDLRASENPAVDWVVSASTLEINTALSVPVTQIVAPDGTVFDEGAPALGVASMGVGVGDLSSTATVEITSIEGNCCFDVTQLRYAPVTSSVAPALWGAPVDPADSSSYIRAGTPISIEGAITGLNIKGGEPKLPTTASSAELADLDFEDSAGGSFSLARPSGAPSAFGFGPRVELDAFCSEIPSSSDAGAARSQIVQALIDAGLLDDGGLGVEGLVSIVNTPNDAATQFDALPLTASAGPGQPS